MEQHEQWPSGVAVDHVQFPHSIWLIGNSAWNNCINNHLLCSLQQPCFFCNEGISCIFALVYIYVVDEIVTWSCIYKDKEINWILIQLWSIVLSDWVVSLFTWNTSFIEGAPMAKNQGFLHVDWDVVLRSVTGDTYPLYLIHHLRDVTQLWFARSTCMLGARQSNLFSLCWDQLLCHKKDKSSTLG